MADPKETNTFPRRGKHKERYMKCGTLKEVASKWVIKRIDQSQVGPKEAWFK